MNKGYELSVSQQLDKLLKAFIESYLIIGIYHWIIKNLYIRLGDQLQGIEIEIIKVEYSGSIPWLGIYYENPEDTRHLEYLIDKTIDQIIEEEPLIKMLDFLNENTKTPNWRQEYNEIMS